MTQHEQPRDEQPTDAPLEPITAEGEDGDEDVILSTGEPIAQEKETR